MNTRRQALSLAAVLAATVVTGGAAVLGLVRTPVQAVGQPAVAQAVQPAPQAPQHWEEGD
jgi:hypothetical protein